MKYHRNFYEIRSNEEIHKALMDEFNKVGYYSLPFQNIEEIEKYAKTISQRHIYVIGIGGSSLGTKAIYSFLKTSSKFTKELYFLDSIDPLKINFFLSRADLNDAHFIVISKSGNTIEPISIFKYVSEKIAFNNKNLTIISGDGNELASYAHINSIKIFNIKESIGGRFSVFSAVGLLPLCIIGVDIKKILLGCREVHTSFFEKKEWYELIIKKARFLVENKSRFNINVIFSYSYVLRDFNKWFVQLWAESLGKININGTRQGLTPVSLIGPDDQHSFLQLIIDGVRDKTVTFFKIENLMDLSKVPARKEFDIFSQNYINEKSFNELINLQADATYETILKQQDIPCDIITLQAIDERNIAILMYRFQLLVSAVGSFLQIDTYNQPGVEDGKKILKKKLEDG